MALQFQHHGGQCSCQRDSSSRVHLSDVHGDSGHGELFDGGNFDSLLLRREQDVRGHHQSACSRVEQRLGQPQHDRQQSNRYWDGQHHFRSRYWRCCRDALQFQHHGCQCSCERNCSGRVHIGNVHGDGGHCEFFHGGNSDSLLLRREQDVRGHHQSASSRAEQRLGQPQHDRQQSNRYWDGQPHFRSRDRRVS